MKGFKLFLIAAMAGCMVFAFTACMPAVNRQAAQNGFQGGTNQQQEESPAWEEEEEPEASGMTLADLVDQYGDTWEEIGSSDITDCKVSARGNTLIYAYTYLDQVDNRGNLVADAIEENLDDNAVTLTQQANTMANLVGEDIVIQMAYYNADGTLLLKKSFNGACS